LLRVVSAGAMLVACAFGSASAQDQPVMKATEADESVLISLDADNVSVNTVLQILAERSGLNIVTGPEVQGQLLSLHLRNTPFEEALDLTVRAAGFGYQRVGQSILVGEPDRLERETGFISYVYTLQYADATEVKKLLEVLSKNVEVDLQGNRLVATGTPVIIEQIKNIVRTVDSPPPTVQIAARVIETSTSELEELGVQWDKIMKFSTVFVEGDPGPSRRDQPPTDLPYYPADGFDNIYRQAEAIEVAVDLLITEGKAKILADSRVVTVANRRAEIFIGDDIPVVITSLSSDAGGFGVQQIQLEHIKVGIQLHVLPRVSDDDFVTLLVEPKVSTIVEFVGPDNDLPRTSERTATTSIRAQNGKTVFVGGLESEDTKIAIRKVPLLGDIPVFGKLFQHQRNDTVKKNLLIELTPTILR
jgi:type II secretory pathway component GspD/PulD (secretin)